jgi:hypothetical protein
VQLVRSCARSLAILLCVDGLASYVMAFLRVFRHPVRTGRRGRPRLVLEQGVLLGQTVKRYARRRVVSVERQVIRGTEEAIGAVLAATKTGVGSKRRLSSGSSPPSARLWRNWYAGGASLPIPRRC